MLLAWFAGAAVEPFVVHTDDGCAVEIHCLACRWAHAAAAIAPPPPRPPLAVEVARAVPPPAERLTAQVPREPLPARGPPAL